MATKTVIFNKSRYLELHPSLNKEILIRNLLLPGLRKQGKLGLGSPGIELPTGEFITLAEAKELIFDYLINQADLGERDQRTLRGVTSNSSFVALADSYINREVVEPKTLGAIITPEHVESLQTSKTKPLVNGYEKFVSSDRIHEYNILYQKILQYSYSGNSAQILARLFPGGIGSSANITQLQLAQVIVSNIVRLRESSNVSDKPEVQNYATAQEFSRILSNYPELEGYRNFLGDESIQATLHQYINSVAVRAEQDNPSALQDMDRLQLGYGQELKTHLLNESELRTQIYNSLHFISNSDRLALTDQILRRATIGSRDGTSLDQILTDLKLDQGTHSQVYDTLHNQGLEVSLNYYQGKLHLQLDTHKLTNGELKLLKKGLNPFLTTLDPHKDVLLEKEKGLLAGYNSKTTTGKQFITLQEAYANEQQKTNPDPIFLIKARDILNRQRYYDTLTPQERVQVESTRFGRWFTNTASRIEDIQDKFTDSTYDLVDTITGKKWLHKQIDKWEHFAEGFTVKIGKVDLPIFRLNSWIIDQFESWKKVRLAKFSTTTSTWSSPFGKWIHQRTKDYQLGGFTLKGMAHVGVHRAWSNFAYKASGKIIKGGLIASERTLRRLLIKVGGKALAKIGIEAFTTLSGVFTIVGIALIVKDVLEVVGGFIKLGWNKLKQTFGSAEGALAGAISSAMIGLAAAWTAGVAFVLGVFSTFILPGVVSGGLAVLIALGSLYLFTHQGGDGFKMSIDLDSGAGQVISSILCDQNSTEAGGASSGNQATKTAACIVKILTDCAINPLTSSNANSSKWQCALASLVAQDAMEELKRSATSYSVLQCVGFVAAVDIASGGTGSFPNAKDMDTIHPSNYKWVSGVGSCSSGDIFVDKNGTWGHTGIFLSNGGPYIQCMDANGGGPGVVRGQGSCQWPSNNIAGCLKRI